MRKLKWLLRLAVFLGIVYFIAFHLVPAVAKRLLPLRYTETVEHYAAAYDVPQDLVYAVILAESGFDENAVSKAGAVGLMQLTDETYNWLLSKEPAAKGDLQNSEVNIHYGVLNLSLLREKYHDENTVLAAYNAGPGNVDKWLADPACSADGVRLRNIPFDETKNYTARVQRFAALYRYFYFS